jgi:hypothetical protein
MKSDKNSKLDKYKPSFPSFLQFFSQLLNEVKPT